MITLYAPPSSGTISGGYRYNQRIVDELSKEPVTYRFLESARLRGALVPQEAAEEVVLDSLYLFDPETRRQLLRPESGVKRAVWLIHLLPHVELEAGGGAEDAVKELRRAEEALLQSRGIICTSVYTRKLVWAMTSRVPTEVCRPGVDLPDQTDTSAGQAGRTQSGRLRFLTVAPVTALKNLLWLLELLSELQAPPWEWRIAGNPHSHSEYGKQFSRALSRSACSDRITLLDTLGEEELSREYRSADLFLFPSLFESYGMAIAEALSYGVPVIANRTGGVAEVTGEGAAAVLCTLNSRQEWLQAVTRFSRDTAFRIRASQEARERAAALPRWSETAERFLRAATAMHADAD